MPSIDAAALAADRAARRLAMLRRFLTAGRAMLLHLSPISRARRSRRGKAKGKGKGTAGGSAAQLRTGQHRDDKRAALLRRFMRQPKDPPRAERAAPKRPQGEGFRV